MQARKSRFTRTMVFGLTTAAALAMTFPSAVFADIDDLKTQQQQQQQQLDAAKQREQDAKQKKDQFQKQINVNANDINKLTADIDAKETEITKLQGSIYTKNQEIEITQGKLTEAEARVKERDKVLKQRLKMMYEQGEVQYLDVLLDATSFSDFLDRFDTLAIIYQQDTEILKKNKADRDTIEATKKKLEDDRNTLTAMKTQQVEQKSELDGLKAQKVALNQQLETDKSAQERIEQEAQQMQDDAIKQIYAISQQISAEQNKQNTTPTQSAGGPFIWPLPGVSTITDEFGDRIDPFTGQRMGHNGMDIAGPQGTTVVAAQTGKVITAGWVTGFGNCIIIDHGGGLWSLYGHLMNGGILVSVGQQVTQGDAIGKEGSTGRSTGPHLHFGVYENGVVVNPRKYL
ncbi:peptidoglycan DD-metalloendopeptidase family protein [Tumebacillus sp. ITR2]|uniref:Peptidoglycan DD-metalloendopeptidase family protein n=1 Tax=Tumebacillus amylolyticus TaxID=2801339 RepID=A0ABS1J9N0_9BACL|nr:peptidoglycan DD-metalloendopeptidase family protein [Tumebacillus amylolyticus]MBL0386979.1 peptidoglycan DD-metalloendopeptidase family protein [Tumebacillus amylolyticus]